MQCSCIASLLTHTLAQPPLPPTADSMFHNSRLSGIPKDMIVNKPHQHAAVQRVETVCHLVVRARRSHGNDRTVPLLLANRCTIPVPSARTTAVVGTEGPLVERAAKWLIVCIFDESSTRTGIRNAVCSSMGKQKPKHVAKRDQPVPTHLDDDRGLHPWLL